MTLRLELLPLLFAVTLASFACHAGGFWLMRFVDVTPRIQAALKAAPLAVMVGIVVPAAVRGGTAEWLGLATTILLMRVLHKDLVAALAGVATAVWERDALVHSVLREKPDIAIVDIRLPPTFRDEGLRAALELRRLTPETAVLIVSQYVEQAYAAELLASGEGGVG